MPIYEYQCNHCKIILEFIELSVKDSHNGVVCPKCQGDSLQKIMSTSAIVQRHNLRIPLKGSKQRKVVKKI